MEKVFITVLNMGIAAGGTSIDMPVYHRECIQHDTGIGSIHHFAGRQLVTACVGNHHR